MKLWKRMLTAAALASALASQPVSAAEGEVIRNEWQNENLGPGVARWVDENGNVSDQTGVRPEDQAQAAEVPDGPGTDVAAKTAADGATAGTTADGAAAGTTADGATAGQDGTGAAAETGETGNEAASAQEGASGGENAGTDGAETAGGDAAAAEGQGETNAQETGRVIDPAKPMVALTFDDGPYAPVGNRIMDCLAQYDAKATFYVVGERVPSYTAELQRMVAEGHEIGNHTYSHKYLNKLNAAQIRQEIDRCADTVQAACGVRPVTVRLPGGNKNATVLATVQEPIVLWNVDTLDWKTRNAQKTVSAVLDHVQDGDIILMHELYQASGDAALQIIPELHNRGYQMVTVSEMAQYRRGGWQNGQVYYNMRP